jgi:hypothetical protein
MGNVNETINYLGNIYPIYKLSNLDPDKNYYFIYFEEGENDIEPINLNINGIENKLDKWHTVEYIEAIDENRTIVKAMENNYFLSNTVGLDNLIKCNDNIYSLLFNCKYCNKQFYHRTRQTCKDCPDDENKINKKYYYYLISTNKQ